MRESFFFGILARALKSDQISVFPVQNAKNPILKICYRQDLWVDISFAIVANSVLTITDDIVD
jgi:hypothetical protein